MPGDRGDRTRGPVWPGLVWPGLAWSEDDNGGMRIALFATCLGDILFPDVPRATTAVPATPERLDRGPRPARPAGRDFPRLVDPHARRASAMTVAREEVLRRVREAVGGRLDRPPVPRDYRRQGSHPRGTEALVEQFIDRLEDYRATVIRASGEVPGALRAALTAAGVTDGQLLHAPGLPAPWLAGTGATPDDSVRDGRGLGEIAAVITGSVVAVAETGTIVLDASPWCGRRALTLVPDVHVCLVKIADVVQTVPEALALLDPCRPLTFISGPSATSDIELSRVEGVHGPRTLVVVLIDDLPPH